MMNITRFLFTLLLLLLFSGCAVKPPSDFLFVTPDKKDTFESLAQEHLGNPSLAWKIQESNDITTITPGDELIIPIKPINPGGLTAKGYQLIPALSYHNFTSGQSKNLLTVSAKNFEDQLNYLKKEKYHTLTLDQLQEFLDSGQAPRNSILLTIDDGWISSYNVAHPMLQKFGFNATLFIPTDYVSSQNRKIISWDQAREMVNDNSINIQCHTKGHRDLNLIEDGESLQSYITSIEDQVVTSKKIINEEIGKQVTSIAYPYGNTNPVAIEILKRNGYKTAFTVKRAKNTFFTPNFLLNRAMIYGVHNMKQFKKNVSVFKKLSLDESEPIDKITDIRNIAYLNASVYEEKGQWRTALLAWKMQRDWLMTHKTDRIKAFFTSKEDSLKKAEKKVVELDKQVKNIAQTHYLAATTSKRKKTIRKHLLRTLLYDPNHHDALVMLRNMPVKGQLTHYKVKKNETFKTIASKLYNKKNNDVLIPLFNSSIKDESDLRPGINLVLPTVSAMNMIKTSEATRCQVKLTKPSSQVAKDLYTEANALFIQDKISEAINKLKKAICLNPNYDIAKEMLEMLQDL
jgi:peptidoglycan/xylan/chitin deacetylase (PgdA/CDA1 family)